MVSLLTKFKSQTLPGGRGFNATTTCSRETGAWLKQLPADQICATPPSLVSGSFGPNLLPFPESRSHLSAYRKLVKLTANLRPAAFLGLVVISADNQRHRLQTLKMDTTQILQVKTTLRETPPTSQIQVCLQVLWSTVS